MKIFQIDNCGSAFPERRWHDAGRATVPRATHTAAVLCGWPRLFATRNVRRVRNALASLADSKPRSAARAENWRGSG